MNSLNQYIIEKLRINKDSKNQYNYHPKTRNELYDLVNKLIEERGSNTDLNDIDTSEITDMHGIFYGSGFNGDISKWDVNNVKDMGAMFAYSKFNGDISSWDVSNVTNMNQMFYNSAFNGDISDWNVINTNMFSMFNMFKDSPLEKNPPKWYKK